MKMKRKMRKQMAKKQSEQEEDSRFIDLAKNPMFREMRKKEQKIQIDDRFKKLLTEKAFHENVFCQMDRRGRPTKNRGRDTHLSHIYELAQDVRDEEQRKRSSDSESDSHGVDGGGEQHQIHLDLARGQGNISSSSDDESAEETLEQRTDQGEEEGMDEANWGELDKEVRRVEWASFRLAICNLDWTNVRAEDLMLLFNSLKPSGGKILSVSVYLSDFGAECIEREKRDGPLLRIKRPSKKERNEAEKDEEDLKERTKQAIHANELDKLRYYYAVCVCDSVDTATAIYETCDGVEYESSGLKFDIRFVPDEMEFESERIREQILFEQFNADWYRPKRVAMHTLTATNPKMSWETDDPERRRALKRAFDEEAKLEDFDAFIGSGTDEEKEDEESQRNANREILLTAAREGNFDSAIAPQSIVKEHVEEEGAENRQMAAKEKIAKDECDGQDREISDEDSEEEEAVEVRTQKRKTKFQLYLERKKQLKQERKRKEAEQRKQRKEAKVPQLADNNEAVLPTNDSHVEGDDRFAAFFTDSAFAIDRTSSHYKGGNLADRQAKEKQKRRQLKT